MKLDIKITYSVPVLDICPAGYFVLPNYYITNSILTSVLSSNISSNKWATRQTATFVPAYKDYLVYNNSISVYGFVTARAQCLWS